MAMMRGALFMGGHYSVVGTERQREEVGVEKKSAHKAPAKTGRAKGGFAWGLIAVTLDGTAR